jgi:uncharacterized protein (DUF58 family)
VSDIEEGTAATVSTEEWLARRRASENTGPETERTARNLRRRAQLRPTVRGGVTLLIGVVALLLAYWVGRRELLAVAGAAFLLPLIGLIAVRLRRPRLDVLRTFSPPVVGAGEPVEVRVRIRNAGSAPSPTLEWNDAIPWQEDDPRPQALAPIPAGSAEQRIRIADYRLRPARRGVYAIGPLVVEQRDAFGMVARVAAVGEQDRLVVIPTVERLPAGGPAPADGEGTARLIQRRVTGNDDDLTTREYRAGDALRRVHWRASARHGELMVRQEEHRSRPDAHIVLDTRAGGYPDAHGDAGRAWLHTIESDAFEWVVRATASLGIHLEEAGFRVEIEETGPAQIEQIGERWEGGRRIDRFLTSLAGVGLATPPAGDISAPAASRGPLFALISDAEDLTADWLARRRRSAGVAIAFAVDPRPELTERLVDAGWSCVPVGADDALADVWRDLAVQGRFAPASSRGAFDGAH